MRFLSRGFHGARTVYAACLNDSAAPYPCVEHLQHSGRGRINRFGGA